MHDEIQHSDIRADGRTPLCRPTTDAQAQAKLEASVRSGSTGKWGNAPMPPFASLKPDELKALAAFVRAQ